MYYVINFSVSAEHIQIFFSASSGIINRLTDESVSWGTIEQVFSLFLHEEADFSMEEAAFYILNFIQLSSFLLTCGSSSFFSSPI